ncbi:tRNA 2-thiouridine(34) synthase MnmA [Helicobacter cappadocius]|uniref:tRNA-specific 2-thiouridylase MnmA n=1 Tax=Helicobacter cappadocius TaxID=3063998 RepID=A0AA90PIM0_9HELI|nr:MULTISPECIES: tRNA 2-thiouridine(34) synthase MnmA [unclassified Helicobacter]MDO7252649.1 tRNA 2-thiouridine(34) synthase MnmA [Helicobacter sp. faydin-H75]MDP2538516.1 tRNA 2-thiouridine(34) synthase MnmA [Helicobacter sp. faydin-H76]
MKVALLMSGGVDSSYSAYLLKSQGYEVQGIYLKLHDKEAKHEIFLRNCKKVSENLGFEFRVVEAKEEFKESVYNEFISSYKRGETPNPCALCNPLMKFGLALELALSLGCEKIATGHYARIQEVNGIKRIAEARDKSKDQSYFLYAISQDAINRLIFPLGDMLKEEVKPKAFEVMPWLGSLETYKESQEICFVETDYIDILKKHTEVEKEGIVRDVQGNIVGKHKGYMQYTIGKRKGFSVKGAHEPHFVVGIDSQNNEIIVGKKEDLATNKVEAINKSLLKNFNGGEYKVKIRYRSTPSEAKIFIDGDKIIAELKEPVYGVAKGQALVVYQDDKVLGGGVII